MLIDRTSAADVRRVKKKMFVVGAAVRGEAGRERMGRLGGSKGRGQLFMRPSPRHPAMVGVQPCITLVFRREARLPPPH